MNDSSEVDPRPEHSAAHDLRGAGGSVYAELRRFVLAADLDGTLIDPWCSDDPKLAAFSRALAAVGERLSLWFNSSRPVASQRESLARVRHLPRPAYLVGAMGTEIQEGPSALMIEAYGRERFGGWPRDAIDAVATEVFGLVPHEPHLQTRYKASYDLPDPDMAAAVEGELQARSLPARIVVSSGKDLDLLPPAAGKAAAIQWLCAHMDVPQEAVIVSGDSANDLDMFAEPFRGIVVANAHPELKRLSGRAIYHAEAGCAAGVLEGLRHFGVLPADEPGLGA